MPIPGTTQGPHFVRISFPSIAPGIGTTIFGPRPGSKPAGDHLLLFGILDNPDTKVTVIADKDAGVRTVGSLAEMIQVGRTISTLTSAICVNMGKSHTDGFIVCAHLYIQAGVLSVTGNATRKSMTSCGIAAFM
jgi:hypothetical protein